MADLINVKTGKPEAVPPELVYQSLASGSHMPGQNERALIDPNGELTFVPAEDFQANVSRRGYSLPTQGDLDSLAQHEKYGEGVGNVLKAGVLGGMRGGTLGGSDFLLRKAGIVSPETLRGLQEENPISSTLGEIGGAVGASALMPESLPGRVAKLGEKTAEGAHAVLRAGARAATREGSLASRALGASAEIAAKGVGSAVEGAAYGLGQSVSEYSMGDPDLNGEKVLANLGYGALYGGGLGAMLKTGAIGGSVAVEKAQNAFGGLYEKYVGRVSELPGPFLEAAPIAKTFEPGIASKAWAKAASMASGEPENEIIQKMIDARNPAKTPLSVSEMRKLAGEQNRELQTFHNSMEKASAEFTPARKEEMAGLLDEHHTAKPLEQLRSINRALDHTIAEMGAEPALFPARFKRELELLREHVKNSLFEPMEPEALFKRETPTAASYSKEELPGSEAVSRHTTGVTEKPLDGMTATDIHETLNEAKQKLGEIVPKGEISDADRRAVNLVKGIQSSIKTGLEHPEFWGEAAARQQGVNAAYTDYLAAQKNFRSEFMKKQKARGYGNRWVVNPTKTQSWFNMINDPRGAIKTDALREYLSSSRALADQMGKTYENAPFSAGTFEKEDLQRLLQKSEQNISRMQNVAQTQPGGHGFVTDALTLGAAGVVGGPLAFTAALAGKGFSAAKNPHGAIEKLVRLEAAANKATRFISTAAKAAVDVSRETLKGVAGAGAVGQILLAPDDRRKRFEKRAEEIQDRNEDPAKAVEHMTLATQDGFHAAPNVMGSIQQASLRGTSFLATKLPRAAVEPSVFSPGTKIPMADIARFDRYYDAVHKPLSVIGGLKHGRVTPEGVEALRTVYPLLYGEMSTTIFNELSARKAKSDKLIPYQQRLALCQFLGAPLDTSMAPNVIAANQQVLAGQEQEKKNEEAQQNANMKFNIAGRTKTDFQDEEEDT